MFPFIFSALLWQLMRFDLLNFIQNLKFGNKKVDEPFMIEWANQKVNGFNLTFKNLGWKFREKKSNWKFSWFIH